MLYEGGGARGEGRGAEVREKLEVREELEVGRRS